MATSRVGRAVNGEVTKREAVVVQGSAEVVNGAEWRSNANLSEGKTVRGSSDHVRLVHAWDRPDRPEGNAVDVNPDEIWEVTNEMVRAVAGETTKAFKKWSGNKGVPLASVSEAVKIAIHLALIEAVMVQDKVLGKCPSTRTLNDVLNDTKLLEQVTHETINLAIRHLQNTDSKYIYSVNIHKRQRKLTDP